MPIQLSDRTIHADEEGYLLDPESWTPELAEWFAEEEGINLTEEHFVLIRFMRDFYHAHRTAADARHVIRFLAQELGYADGAHERLFELFPYGYVQQACRIAGMKRSRARSTG